VAACRASIIARMQVLPGGARSALSIPDDAVSLLVHNPSQAIVLLRWGATPVDGSDIRGGYDLSLPGCSFTTLPIPDGETQVSFDWMYPLDPSNGAPVLLDISGRDFVTIESTPNNQSTESSSMDLAAGWVHAEQGMIGFNGPSAGPSTWPFHYQAANLVNLASPARIISVDVLATGVGGTPPIGGIWTGDTYGPTALLAAGQPAILSGGGWYESAINLVLPAGDCCIGVWLPANADIGSSNAIPGAYCFHTLAAGTVPEAWGGGGGTGTNVSWCIRAQIVRAV
jgi:hypothetical protein